jgi:hypothetical protein
MEQETTANLEPFLTAEDAEGKAGEEGSGLGLDLNVNHKKAFDLSTSNCLMLPSSASSAVKTDLHLSLFVPLNNLEYDDKRRDRQQAQPRQKDNVRDLFIKVRPRLRAYGGIRKDAGNKKDDDTHSDHLVNDRLSSELQDLDDAKDDEAEPEQVCRRGENMVRNVLLAVLLLGHCCRPPSPATAGAASGRCCTRCVIVLRSLPGEDKGAAWENRDSP